MSGRKVSGSAAPGGLGGRKKNRDKKVRKYRVVLCTPFLEWEGVEARSRAEAIEACGLPPWDGFGGRTLCLGSGRRRGLRKECKNV